MADDLSILQKISVVDVWVGQLDPRIQEGIEAGAINPDLWKVCFSQHPQVMVEMMKVAGIGEIISAAGTPEARAYLTGQHDLAKKFLTIAALEGKKDAETMVDD